jgi:flagellar biosynthesis/type III secretory pathway protein FliH
MACVLEAKSMIRRRVWRDAALADERVVLGALQHRAPVEPSDVPRATPRVDVVLDHDAREQLQQAQGHVEQLESELQATRQQLADAKATLEQLHGSLLSEQARAKEQGHAEGLRQGQQAAHRALEDQLAQWRQSADEMLRAAEARTQTLRAELTDVVLASVVKILGEQAANPHMIRAAVEQTLKESSAGAPLKVLLAPTQFEQLMKSGPAHLGWFKERRLEIAPDGRVTHGGCLLETPSGLIDGRLDTQLTRLHEIISAHFAGSAR